MTGVELFAPRTARHRRTWTIASIILIVAFFIVGQLLTIFGILKPMGYHQVDLETNWKPLAIVLAGFGLTALLIFAWVWLFERRSPKALGFNSKGVIRYIRGLFIGFAFISAVIGIIWVLGGYRVVNQTPWAFPTLATALPIVTLFGGYMIQGATEETMLRGWLMQLLASRHGLLIAIAINAIFFALLHAGNIDPSRELVLGLINLFLFAVTLSLYAINEGSLWGVCAFHSAWNTLLGVGFGLEVSGQKIGISPLVVGLEPTTGAAWWFTGGAFGPEASVVNTAVLTTATIYLLIAGALKPKPIPFTAPQLVQS